MTGIEYNYIRDNYKDFSNLIYQTLERHPYQDAQTRENFKEVVSDYLVFLYQLNDYNTIFDTTLQPHKEYSKKLGQLCDKFKKNPNYIQDSQVEGFVKTLQSQMRNYLHEDCDKRLYKVMKEFHTEVAWSKEVEKPVSRLNNLKEQAFNTLQNKLTNNLG
jgi:hypothetical protein